MDSFTKLISALLDWAWLGIGLWALWRLFPSLVKILESRGFTLKIAGQELTVQATAEQLSTQIADLQNQVIELRKGLQPQAMAQPALLPAEPPAAQALKPAAILWVDDNPSNNAWEVAQLRQRGVEVAQATSTVDGLALAARRPDLRAIISDMGRREAGHYRASAGLELLAGLRADGIDLPFLVYTTSARAARQAAEVRNAGGDGATASAVELVEWVAKNVG